MADEDLGEAGYDHQVEPVLAMAAVKPKTRAIKPPQIGELHAKLLQSRDQPDQALYLPVRGKLSWCVISCTLVQHLEELS